jgi:hypothetical protein
MPTELAVRATGAKRKAALIARNEEFALLKSNH